MAERNYGVRMTGIIKMDKNERLRAALRSTDEDLFIDERSDRVIVCGKNDAGKLVVLGWVGLTAGYQKGVDTRMLIDIIRFGH